eukprot:1681084-Rhodomonas_salina.2
MRGAPSLSRVSRWARQGSSSFKLRRGEERRGEERQALRGPGVRVARVPESESASPRVAVHIPACH